MTTTMTDDNGVTNEDDDDDDDDGGADDDDEDEEDDEDDAHRQRVAVAREVPSQRAASAAAGEHGGRRARRQQRVTMRSSAPHPALEMDFDFGDHFGAFKHASAFEVPASDLFGFGHDDHMSGLLQGDEVTAVGTHTDYVELLRGDSGQNVTSGLFQADDDELLEDDGAFGHHAVNIPPV
jgi:hypothetical protein